MGYVHATIELNNPREPELQPIRITALADTGALMLCIPEHLALELKREQESEREVTSRLEDLRIPPGNRLEALRGDRAGQHSIRINDQFRVCFNWADAGPEAVEIVDYH